MHVTDLRVNQLLGIQLAPPESPHLLELPDSPVLRNHVGTVHASMLFALAEACSGEFLLQHLGERQAQVFAVLRASSTKFRRPAIGALTAKARFQSTDPSALLHELDARGRVVVAIDVDASDASAVVVMSGQFDWFLQVQRSE